MKNDNNLSFFKFLVWYISPRLTVEGVDQIRNSAKLYPEYVALIDKYESKIFYLTLFIFIGTLSADYALGFIGDFTFFRAAEQYAIYRFFVWVLKISELFIIVTSVCLFIVLSAVVRKRLIRERKLK